MDSITYTRRSDETFDDPYVNEVVYTKRLPTPGTTSVYYSTPKLASSDQSGFYGWDISDFHKRRRRGDLLPMTDFGQFFNNGETQGNYNVVFYSSPYYVYYWTTSDCWRYSDAWVIPNTTVHSYIPDTYNEYVAEAAAKIYGNGHDTLTFLAELSDVRKMFIGTARRLLRLQLPKNWRHVTADWLSARYGWRPLIYDLRELDKAIRSIGDTRKRYSERAGNTHRFTAGNSWTADIAAGTLDLSYQDTIELGIRGSVVADVEIPKFQFNPLMTGWELIPFSFVVDWFVNVGKTLAAISFLALRPNYVASCGYRCKVTRQFQVTLGTKSSSYYSGNCWQTGSYTAIREKRMPCSIPYLPSFVVRLNPLKILDILALLLQRLR